MNTPIHDYLIKYTEAGFTRCHMPGDKGRTYPMDITEIYGADSLYEAEGIIKESEINCCSLYGSEMTLYSCSGSTLSIQTMLALVKMYGRGNTIVASRYCHKSLVSTCALLGLDIKWIIPKEYMSAVVSSEEVENAIDNDTAAVFLTSVDYYGGKCDIKKISEVCHREGVYLLADNAHGAYLYKLGQHPISLGADMCADSAHKTLPVITGGAYLHIANPLFTKRAKETMNTFGTSSPSYLILDSLDKCNLFMAENDCKTAFNTVSEIKKALSEMGFKLRESDELRVTVDANAAGYSGFQLAQLLREKKLECEMADFRYLVLLYSVITEKKDKENTISAFKSIKPQMPITIAIPPITVPKQAMSINKAFFAPSETVAVKNSIGRICGGITAPCPPCVPIVMCGEYITEEVVRVLEFFRCDKIRVVK